MEERKVKVHEIGRRVRCLFEREGAQVIPDNSDGDDGYDDSDNDYQSYYHVITTLLLRLRLEDVKSTTITSKLIIKPVEPISAINKGCPPPPPPYGG